MRLSSSSGIVHSIVRCPSPFAACRRFVWSAACLGLLGFNLLNGCASPAVIAAAAATAGFTLAQGQAEAYINGKLKAARLVPLDQAHQAALAMAHDLQLEVHEQWITSTRAYVRAQSKNGPSIKVSIQYKSPVMSKFIIRVGLMGDQAVSTLVLWRIDAHLPHSAHAPIDPHGFPPLASPATAPASQPHSSPQ